MCPPAYYADLACERGRCYIARFLARHPDEIAEKDLKAAFGTLSNGIKDTMFYL